jgi:phospholipid/cholesterol/gamma-HCH transport system ATP-binding protein
MELIVVKDFKKSFGTKVVHNNVNFSVIQGECLGLIGGSGTGKSVLLRSLIGLEKPDGGSILFEGKDICKMRETELIDVRKKIAYVFQGGALFDSMTVYENLAYPLRAHTKLSESEISEKVFFQLAEFGLEHNEQLYPANLSGGMQKRVGLARSIIMGPEIILYDEPTAGLDPFNTKRIQEMILQMKAKGRTSILVTHDMPVAFAVCDRIAMLMNGQIASIGTTTEIKNKSNEQIQRFVQGEVS